MELNILNPESNDYCEAVGITPERQKELSQSLDEMVRKMNTGPVRIGKMHDVFVEIASYCNNLGEAFYCAVLHCGWHARRGRILAPGPLNYATIGLGIELLWDRLGKDITVQSRKIMAKLLSGEEESVIKEGCREGVQRLLDWKEFELAQNIIVKL